VDILRRCCAQFKSSQNVFNVTFKPLSEKENSTLVRRLFRDILQTVKRKMQNQSNDYLRGIMVKNIKLMDNLCQAILIDPPKNSVLVTPLPLRCSSVGSRKSLSVGPDKTWSSMGCGEDVEGTVHSCV
jgi:hypothetical protein